MKTMNEVMKLYFENITDFHKWMEKKNLDPKNPNDVEQGQKIIYSKWQEFEDGKKKKQEEIKEKLKAETKLQKEIMKLPPTKENMMKKLGYTDEEKFNQMMKIHGYKSSDNPEDLEHLDKTNTFFINMMKKSSNKKEEE